MNLLGKVASAVAASAIVGQFAPTASGIPPLLRRLCAQSAGVGAAGNFVLTFDDGPHPRGTPAILSTLSAWDCTATFFLIGEQVLKHPDLVREIVDRGNEVAVHGWNHMSLPRLTPGAFSHQLRDAKDVIAEAAQLKPLLYRPPYGVITGSALWSVKKAGLQPLWWSAWGRDWSSKATPTRISQSVLRSTTLARSGTILLHDSDSYGNPGSWEQTNRSLPLILANFRLRNLQVGAARTHLFGPGLSS